MSSDGFSLDCASDDPFDACSLGARRGESREVWLARLKRRFIRQPIPGLPNRGTYRVLPFVRREDHAS